VKEKKEGKKEKASKNEEKKKEAEGEEKESPIKVNLYDSNAIRQTLDDCVLKILEDEGYAESTFLSNVKLILGFITCAIALYSHFGPTPYPQNKPVLLICCISYLLLNGLIQFISFFIEKNSVFLFSKEKNISLEVSSNLPRWEEIYSLSISMKGVKQKNEKEMKKSITSWFDTEGVFREEIFSRSVIDLLRNIENRKME